jgi:hypothetical protein
MLNSSVLSPCYSIKSPQKSCVNIINRNCGTTAEFGEKISFSEQISQLLYGKNMGFPQITTFLSNKTLIIKRKKVIQVSDAKINFLQYFPG